LGEIPALSGLPPILLSYPMGNVVNLRTERKRARRRRAEGEAAAHRLAYGTPKADRNLQRARTDKDHRKLDQHRVERGDQQ